MIVLQVIHVLLFISYGLCETYDELKAKLPEKPRFNGVMGKYINYPGLSFEPNIDGLIRYNTARESTFIQYTDRIDSMLEEYENVNQQKQIDCAAFSEYRPSSDWRQNCRFDLMVLGSHCSRQNKYGFDYAQPCIALTLERIENWLPERYTNETVPDKVRDNWEEYSIAVHCEGDNPVTKDNIGNIVYYPREGFNFKYFPNTGIDGWKNPIVFISLANPMPAVVLRVTCSVYANNIKHLDKFRTGKVSFDIMID